MLQPHLIQAAGDVVFVDRWEPDEEFPYLGLGQKPKRVLVCPSPAPHSYLIGGHRYLFKEPEGNYSRQLWSEVIAYKLASELAIDVPPAFVAYDRRKQSCGVLIEYFFGYASAPESRLVHARELFQATRKPFDPKRGSLHENIVLSRMVHAPRPMAWWAETVAFDTLIGNTDRHSENWGFLVEQDLVGKPTFRFAPAFDNGSSLGWIVRDEQLLGVNLSDAAEAFVRKGSHHIGWVSVDKESARHTDLCRVFLNRHGLIRPALARIASVSDSQIERSVAWCVAFDFPVTFSDIRSAFVIEQIRTRREAIRRCIGG